MKRFSLWKKGLAATLLLFLAACGGGGGGGSEGGGGSGTNLDRDGDGVPNTADSFPDDPTRFASFATVLLANLTGGQFGTAVAINASGRAVGFSGDNLDAVKAVFWDVDAVAGTAGAPTLLSPLNGAYSAAYGINDQGTVVGESSDGGGIVAVAWPAGGTTPAPLPLGTFVPPAAAYGVDAGGRIAGEASDDSGNTRAVLWPGGDAAPVTLGNLPGGTYSAAYAMGTNGIIVGEADNAAGETRGVAWALTPLGAVFGPVDLGTPSASFHASTAFGVDSSGRVVGESETVTGEAHATLWILDPITLVPTSIVDLGGAGSHSAAYAINDENRIAGFDGRGGSLVPSLLDTRNLGLIGAIFPGGGSGMAFGLSSGNVAVGLAGSTGFAAIPR